MSPVVVVQGRITWDNWIELPCPMENGANFGGSGANIAVTLSALGATVEVVGRLGSDAIGRSYLRYLRRRGVGTEFVDTSDAHTSVCDISPGNYYSWRSGRISLPNPSASVRARALASASAFILVDDAPVPGQTLPDRSFWVPQMWLRSEIDRFLTPMEVLQLWSWRIVFLNAKEAMWMEDLSKRSLVSISQSVPRTLFVRTDEIRPTVSLRAGRASFHPVLAVDPVVALGGGDALAAGCIAGDVHGLEPSGSIALGQMLARQVVSQVGCQVHASSVVSFRSGLSWDEVLR